MTKIIGRQKQLCPLKVGALGLLCFERIQNFKLDEADFFLQYAKMKFIGMQNPFSMMLWGSLKSESRIF